MPTIEKIVKPYRNRISVSVPREYGSYSFQVILVPLSPSASKRTPLSGCTKPTRRTFIDALLSCPKLADGETLDVCRDAEDFGRDIDI